MFIISSIITFNPTPGDSSTDTIPYYMFEASNTFKVDIGLLYAFCRVESLCKSKAYNKDDGNKQDKAKGLKIASHGLFQLQLGTAKALGFKGKRKDLMKPEINTYYAAKYIRHLIDKYTDIDKVIAAYNAGEGKVDNWMKQPHPRIHNVKYVHKVLKRYVEFQMGLHKEILDENA